MDFEGGQSSTPRESKKKGVSKAASSLRKLGRRLSKSISSDRGTGSASSLDNAPEPVSKRFSLRPRRTKKETRSLAERGAVTDRAAPRRSFSVDDMTNFDTEGEPVAPFDPDVKVPALGDAVQFVHEISQDASEGLVPPETPVPERDHEQRPTGDTRSSSSANVSGNDDAGEVEEKEVRFDLPEDEDMAPVDHDDAGEEIELPPSSPFDIGNDAVATIDAQIEQTVIESFSGKDRAQPFSEPEAESEPEVEAETESEPVVEVASEPVVAEQQPTEKTEMVVPEVEGGVIKPSEAMGAEADVGMIKKDRGIDMADLMPQPAPVTSPEPATDMTRSNKKGASISKPKRRRRFRVFKSVSVYSLATMAVGVLFMIIKNKH